MGIAISMTGGKSGGGKEETEQEQSMAEYVIMVTCWRGALVIHNHNLVTEKSEI